jgi:hypothetical protein
MPGRYWAKSVPISSTTFLGPPDRIPTPNAVATTSPEPAEAGTVDEDAAR